MHPRHAVSSLMNPLLLAVLLLLRGTPAAAQGGVSPGVAVSAPVPQRLTLKLSPSEITLAPGDSLAIEATVRDPGGRKRPAEQVRWRSSNDRVASVSPAGVVTAHSGGIAGITATAEGELAVATITVLASAPPPAAESAAASAAVVAAAPPAARGSRARLAPASPAPSAPPAPRPAAGSRGRIDPGGVEPPGFRMLTSRPFNSLARRGDDERGAEGWKALGEWTKIRNQGIVNDPTAPVSPPWVAEIRYPAGRRGGTGPGLMSIEVPGAPRALYASAAMKLSPNFFGHPTSGVNKLMRFFCANTTSSGYFSAQGQGRGRLQPQLRLESIASNNRNLVPNLDRGAVISRGAWHRVSFLLVANEPGRSDGEAHMWLDGRKIMEYRNVAWLAPGESAWNLVHVTSIWGGGGSVVPDDMYVRWDHVYVSTR